MKNKKLLSIFIGIAGFIYSIYLGYDHYELLSGRLANSWCNMGALLNCDFVNSSKYSEVFGISLGFLGALYFGAFVVAIYLDSILIGVFNLVSIFSVVALLGISSFVLKTWCIQCIIIYCLSLTLLSLNRPIWRGIPEFATLIQWIVGLGIALGLLVLLNANIRESFELDDPISEEELYSRYVAAKQVPIPIREETPQKGASKPIVTITDFADLRCPHCKRMAQSLSILVKEFPEKVQVRFRHFPLSAECNKSMKGPHAGFEWVCTGVLVANCAHEQNPDYFWQIHDLYYQNQENITLANVMDYLPVGIDKDKLKSCVDAKGKAYEQILRDVEDANLIPVEGTPTLLINGRYLETPLTYPRLKKLVNAIEKHGS